MQVSQNNRKRDDTKALTGLKRLRMLPEPGCRIYRLACRTADVKSQRRQDEFRLPYLFCYFPDRTSRALAISPQQHHNSWTSFCLRVRIVRLVRTVAPHRSINEAKVTVSMRVQMLENIVLLVIKGVDLSALELARRNLVSEEDV
jgi:hypothetical protein